MEKNPMLRAEATPFVPSFDGNQAPTNGAAENTTSGRVHDNRSQKKSQRRKHNNIGPAKKRQGADSESTATKNRDNGSGGGNSSIPSRSKKKKNRRQNSQQRYDRQPKQPTVENEPAPATQVNNEHSISNKSNSQKKRPNRRRRNRTNRPERQTSHDQQQEQSNEDLQHVMNRQEAGETTEASFPALSSFPTLGTGTSGDDRRDEQSVPQHRMIYDTWSQAKPELLFLSPEDTSAKQRARNDDFFEKMGLDRLSSQRRPLADSTEKETPVDEKESDSGDARLQPSTHTTADSAPREEIRRRPRINMDKLRDRWWDAIAQKRLQREMQAELQLRLEKRFVPPVVLGDEGSELSATALHNNSNDAASARLEPIASELDNVTEKDAAGSNMSYTESLDRAIQTNDRKALKQLLASWVEESSVSTIAANDDKGNETLGYDAPSLDLLGRAVNLVVDQDRPDLLMAALSFADNYPIAAARTSRKQDGRHKELFTRALLQAAFSGRDECLSRLICSAGAGSALVLGSRNKEGNNVLHCCCSGSASEATLRVLLKELSGTAATSSTGGGRHQQVSKLLLSENNLSQTPMHVACEKGRVDFVETFLAMCSSALLYKALALEDAQGQTPLLAAVAANTTDVVIALIMWRGNSCYTSGNKPLSETPLPSSRASKNNSNPRAAKKLPPCPLVWACKNGNLELVHVLLQFSDPSGSSYRTSEAICAIIQSSEADEEIKVEAVRVLVESGGNPFSLVLPFDGIGEEQSALRLAVKSGSNAIIRTLVKSGRAATQRRQAGRRRDPKLQQQPDTFFQPIEAKENHEMINALKLSLLESLICGAGKTATGLIAENEVNKHLSAAVTLYGLGARIGESDLIRLRLGLDNGKLKPEDELVDHNAKSACLAVYKHYLHGTVDPKRLTLFDRSPLNGCSRRLLQQEWMQDDVRNNTGCTCPWVGAELETVPDGSWENLPAEANDRVLLLLEDGVKLAVHGSIVSRKSAKLASAIRFAEMSQGNKSTNSESKKTVEVQVALSSQVCKRMLQHIYHGSLFSGWSRNNDENCHDILELMLVGEEFLCPSLIQECQMRLMSSEPTQCFCWSCAQEVRLLDFDTAECAYCAEGPPALLTSETVLDALAVAQHLVSMDLQECDTTFVPLSLTAIQRLDSTFAKLDQRTTLWKKRAGLTALVEAAIKVLLKEFAAVIESYSFRASLELNPSSSEDSDGGRSDDLAPKILLLQMCLEEFQALQPVDRSSGDNVTSNRLAKTG